MKIIRSNIFLQFPEIVFGMSTLRGGVSGDHLDLNLSFNVGDIPENVVENRNRFFKNLNVDEKRVAFPLQEHTETVLECLTPGKYPHCDGLITSNRDLFLAVTIADCTPVILYDSKKKVIAAVHAGWRGTARAIAVNALTLMINRKNTKAEDVFAFIGPSAGACCYEVGEEVIKYFPSSCSTPKNNGKYLLDVKKTNMLQLLENGLQESHIEVHSDCTIHNKDFHSFRRDGGNSGRMAAIIGLR